MDLKGGIARNRTKRIKRVMNLQQKVRILDLLVGGMTTAAVSRKYGVNESTIRCIRGQEHKIRQLAYRYPCAKRAQFSKREVLLTKMEGLLVDWIADETTDNSRPNAKAICEKAIELFHVVKSHATVEEIGEGAVFIASRGWFNNFRKRHLMGDLSLRPSTCPEDVAKYDTVPSPTFDMLNTSTLDTSAIKPEPEDHVDSQMKIYPEAGKQGSYGVFISPLYQTLNAEDRCDEGGSGVAYHEDSCGHVAPDDSEPSDNETDASITCGQSINPHLSIEKLKIIVNMVETLKGYIAKVDPDAVRSSCVSHKIDNAFSPYSEMYKELKDKASQPRITQFFKPIDSSREGAESCETNSFVNCAEKCET